MLYISYLFSLLLLHFFKKVLGQLFGLNIISLLNRVVSISLEVDLMVSELISQRSTRCSYPFFCPLFSYPFILDLICYCQVMDLARGSGIQKEADIMSNVVCTCLSENQKHKWLSICSCACEILWFEFYFLLLLERRVSWCYLNRFLGWALKFRSWGIAGELTFFNFFFLIFDVKENRTSMFT